MSDMQCPGTGANHKLKACFYAKWKDGFKRTLLPYMSNILILYGLNIFVLVWALLLCLQQTVWSAKMESYISHKYLYGCN